jgi:hypothetical protein
MICSDESATLLPGGCVLGLVLPYSRFVPWLMEHGLNFTVFFRELFANRISAFFAMDAIVSAIVLIWFIQSEGKRLRVRLLWLPTVGTLVVGCIVWILAFYFSKAGDVGPNNWSSFNRSSTA